MLKYMVAAALLALPGVAGAQSVISNGTIQLGVDSRGQLNFGGFGVYDLRTEKDGTRAGCLCEGWGVAIEGTGIFGEANNSTGIANLTVNSFASTASTAVSSTSLTSGQLSVLHSFAPSGVADLYQVDVTITNQTDSTTAGNLLYRRLMDWDVEPTAFNEFVTIQGSSAANIKGVNRNGFAEGNPLSDPGAYTGDFVDNGPTDHGALFDFTFSPLAAGASQTFSIFYGAALSEPSALAALGSVGAEVYSFGQSSDDKLGGTPGYSTFIFGFKGVGGTALPDPTAAVPEPATWAMMIFGFGVVGGSMRRRRRTDGTLATA